jgi:hypothetical protein
MSSINPPPTARPARRTKRREVRTCLRAMA